MHLAYEQILYVLFLGSRWGEDEWRDGSGDGYEVVAHVKLVLVMLVFTGEG